MHRTPSWSSALGGQQQARWPGYGSGRRSADSSRRICPGSVRSILPACTSRRSGRVPLRTLRLDCRGSAIGAGAGDRGSPARALLTPEDLLGEYAVGPRNGSYFLRRAVRRCARRCAFGRRGRGHRRSRRRGAARLRDERCRCADQPGACAIVADVLWRSLRAVLEIDSRAHHGSERDWLATMRGTTHSPPRVRGRALGTDRYSRGHRTGSRTRSTSGSMREPPNSALVPSCTARWTTADPSRPVRR